MATSIQLGLIAVGISLAIVAVVNGIGDLKKSYKADPVNARYEYIDRECAKRSADGYMPGRITLPERFATADGVKQGAYAICPLK